MRLLYLYFVGYVARFLLSLRYKVVIRGLDDLVERTKDWKGILFIPNHIAHIDPIMILAYFWPQFKLRPIIVEYISHIPLLRLSIPLIRGVLVPDFETSINQYKVRKAEKVIQTVIEGLEAQDNFVIFPSGKFKNQGKEKLSGASMVHSVLQLKPDAHVVLIRFSGLWGSSFSKALTGKSPSIVEQTKNGVKTLLKNLLFFTPRRKVFIDVCAGPLDLPRSGSRVEVNQFLENWYNQYSDDEGNIHTSEPLKLVRNCFWSKEMPSAAIPPPRNQIVNTSQGSRDIEMKIVREIRKILDQPNLNISPDMLLGDDLGMDSLNIAEMVAYLSKNYSVQEVDFEDLQKVEDLIAAASGALKLKEIVEEGEKFKWPQEDNRPSPECSGGTTFHEVFLNICQKMGSFSAMGDDVSGTVSYKRCKKGVLVLAEAFRKFPEKHVAVLLPSSVGSTLVILALLFADKIPVPLNWTLGPRSLEQMMKISGAKRAISSWRFMEKINFVDFGSVADQIVLLEDIRMGLTLKTKLKGAILSLFSPVTILKKLKLSRLDENSTAVILFTSGSESTPKGVPLSHKNILSTIRNCYKNLQGNYTSSDAMYGILPQFHSFGFSNSTFTPLFCGMRVAFYPNPADSLALAEGIHRWKITFVPIVPNFLNKILDVARDDQLNTVRFFITAGEKTPAKLFDRVKNLNTGAILLEGYGLSETSPVLAMMQLGKTDRGVGQLFPDVEAITIHPETHQLIEEGSQGEVCVRGPNVFQGYIGNAPSPFIEIGGKSWFRTGDLGYLEKDRTLILTGRLKRFVKIGGEMISLGGIEEALAAECRKRGLFREDVPSLAICVEGADSENPKLILFSIFDMETELANDLLKDSGFSNLIKISKTRQVDEIPLMGTGKTNYRSLQAQID